MTDADAEDPWGLIPNWVGEALALHADGRPIARVRSGMPPEEEVDPMSPVVIAFQGMVQDQLGERGRPVSAVYGEKVLSLVPGQRVHVATVAGVGHVGIGSDFEGGIRPPANLASIADVQNLPPALRAAGLSDSEVRRIMGENALGLLGSGRNFKVSPALQR